MLDGVHAVIMQMSGPFVDSTKPRAPRKHVLGAAASAICVKGGN
jgi:hypothetical protein